MEIYKQEAPFSIQVELAEGCSLACSFCGINGIREKSGGPYKFMEASTLKSLIIQVKELKWNPRMEFAMHGEPTMHPDYVGMIKLAYEIHPKLRLMMTTNGSGLLRKPGPEENIKALFRNGLDVLALDDYVGVKFVEKIRPCIEEVCRVLQIDHYEYPKEDEGNPHRRGRSPFISIIADISQSASGTHSRLANHAGAAFPKDYSMNGQRCHRPFRELSIRWDGNVSISCEDWRGEYPCGNIVTDGLLGVWHSEAFEAARRKLIRGERDFGPCHGCSARSYRVGLLPDKKGQAKMLPPDEESNAVIQRVLAKGPLTKPVLRPWEIPEPTLFDK